MVAIVLFWMLVSNRQLNALEPQSPRSASELAALLKGQDLQARRSAAIAARTADAATKKQLLPVLIDLLKHEKDGQVRLAVLDAVTDMGPAAKSAIPALVYTLRTEYGGKYNEERHQDYRSALALAAVGSPAVNALRELLAESAENVRAEAAMALGRIGPEAAPAVPALVGLLDDEDERVRRDAVGALGRIGAKAVAPLISAAANSDADVRAGAIEALGLTGVSNQRVAEAVLLGTRASQPQVRRAAVTALGALQLPNKEKRDALLANLRHEDAAVRNAVVNVLTGDRDALVQLKPNLEELLVAKHDGVSWHAAFLLQQLGADEAQTLLTVLRDKDSRIEQIARALALSGPSIVGMLTSALDDPNPRVRQGAALALGDVRPLPTEVVKKLAAGLDDPEPKVQAAYLASIGRLGPRGRLAAPAVRRKLRDASAQIREQAIGILFEAAPRDNQLIDDLAGMIADADPAVQRRAIDALRAAGPLGRRTLSAVIPRLESPHREVRLAAAAMIGSHGRAAAEAAPALVKLLGQPDPETQVIVTQTLSELGPAALPALDKLIELVSDENASLRAASLKTLANLDVPPEKLRPYFSQALGDTDYDVRRQAHRGIRQFGERGVIFLPDLIRLLADDEPSRYVKRALERFERYGPDPTSLSELVELLEHKHSAVRLHAVRFLGLAGPAAKTAVSSLQPRLKDADQEVRKAVEKALLTINTSSP